MLSRLYQDLGVFRTSSPNVLEVALGKTHCEGSTSVVFYHRIMTVTIFMIATFRL